MLSVCNSTLQKTMIVSATASVSMSIRERKGEYETLLSLQIQIVILSVSALEEGSALVEAKTIVVHLSIVTLVLVWMIAQPLTPTLHAMRATLFAVSKEITFNLVCLSIYFLGIDWLDSHHKQMHSVQYFLSSWLHTKH